MAPLEQSLRAIWGAASQAAVLTWPQTKLNLQLSRCASILVNVYMYNWIALLYTSN